MKPVPDRGLRLRVALIELLEEIFEAGRDLLSLRRRGSAADGERAAVPLLGLDRHDGGSDPLGDADEGRIELGELAGGVTGATVSRCARHGRLLSVAETSEIETGREYDPPANAIATAPPNHAGGNRRHGLEYLVGLSSNLPAPISNFSGFLQESRRRRRRC